MSSDAETLGRGDVMREAVWPWGLLVAGVALLALPFGLNAFWTRVGVGVFMWIGLAQSWNMIGGYAGYLDFGHGAYFGVGGFVTAIAMTTAGLPFLVSIVLAAVAGAVLALIVGVPTLRLQGAYFAIATWVFAEGMKQLALVLGITGGTYGMSLPTGVASFGLPVPALNESTFYYVMLVLTVATIALTYWLFENSGFGLRVKALRDNERAAESVGIDTTGVKRRVYVLSCVVAAVFGSVNAYHISFIHPNDVFSPLITDQMVIMALVGGLGTLVGPIVGGVVIFLLMRLSPIFFGSSTIYLVVIGVLIMLTVLFTPNGIVGLLRGDTGSGSIRENARELASRFDIV